MEVTEAVTAQAVALIAADSGAGGLAETGGAAFLRQVLREGDSEQVSLTDYPVCVLDVTSQNIGPVTANCQHFGCVLTFTITHNRDPGPGGLSQGGTPRATIDAVMGRIQTVFDGTTLASLADTDAGARTWYFSPMTRVFAGTPQSTESRMRQVVSYKLFADKGVT